MGWNGSDCRSAPGPAAAKPQKGHGNKLAMLFVLLASAGVAVFLWMRNTRVGEAEDLSTVIRINRVNDTSLPRTLQTTEEVVKAVAQVPETDRPGPVGAEPTNEAVRARQGVVTNAEILAMLEKFKREPAQGRAEQLLLMVSPSKKGDRMPPPPIGLEGDEDLEKEALEMLERVGKVEEWDTEQTIRVKEELEALKDEWYAAKKEGLSFHGFLQRKVDAMDHDADIVDEVRKFDDENYNDENLSDAEYQKQREKANKLLKIQGFDELPKHTSGEEE